MGNDWEDIYKEYNYKTLPWHTETPDPILDQLVSEKTIKPGKALDMCSGAGTNSLFLARKGFEVYGIDISETAISIAKRRAEEEKTGAKFLVGDVLDPRIKEKFDLVFDRGCFHHIQKKDKPRYVKNVLSLLKKNGKFFLQCFSDKNLPFEKNISKEDIQKYYGKDFDIKFIKDTVHLEPYTGFKRYMYTVFMEKKVGR